MQQELQRIRNNDYSSIDEKLYNNLNMSNDLDHTIAQLAQLQRYLKNQIDSIQDQGQKQAALRASKVVLQMSCMKNQSNIIKTCQCYHIFRQVHDKIKKLKRNFKNFRQKIERQMKDCMSDFTEQLTQNLVHMSGLLNKKSIQNTKTRSQLYICQQQINDLKQKNQQLTLKLQQWQQAVKKRKQKMKAQVKDQKSIISVYMNTENPLATYRQSNQQFFSSCHQQLQKFQQRSGKNRTDRQFIDCIYTENDKYRQSQNQTPRLPMPLRRQSSSKQYGIPLQRHNSCASINRRESNNLQEQVNRIVTAKNSPTKLKISQTIKQQIISNHGINNRQKQNLIFKLKGNNECGNRKPAKKLKLFSIM